MQALDATAVGDQSPRTVTAVDALMAASRVPEATELARSALAAGKTPPEVAAELRLTLASSAFMKARRAEAVSQAEAVLVQTGLDDEVYAAAELTRLIALMAAGDFLEARYAAEVILGGGGRAGDASLAGALTAVGSIAWIDGRVGEAIGLLRAAVTRAEAESPVARHMHPRQSLAVMVAAMGEFDEAEGLLVDDRREIERVGDRAWTAAVTIRQACLHRAAGRLEDAEREAQAGATIADELGTPLFVPLALSTRAAAALLRGDPTAAADHVARCRAVVGSDRARFESVLCDWVEAQMVDTLDGPEAAVEVMAGVYADPSAHVRLFLEEPAAPAWLMRTAIRAVDWRRAERIATAVGFLAARNRGFVSITATAAHTRGLLDRDATALAEAAASHRHPYALGAALEDSGRLLAECDTAAARSQLERSVQIYEQIGAERDVERVSLLIPEVRSTRRRREPDGVGGWGGLSGSERRVAGLVARGLTNVDIGHRLFLSRHTIDFHLRQIFNKLHIHSRIALTRLVAERNIDAEERSTR